MVNPNLFEKKMSKGKMSKRKMGNATNTKNEMSKNCNVGNCNPPPPAKGVKIGEKRRRSRTAKVKKAFLIQRLSITYKCIILRK